jgi:hypothetical protein
MISTLILLRITTHLELFLIYLSKKLLLVQLSQLTLLKIIATTNFLSNQGYLIISMNFHH